MRKCLFCGNSGGFTNEHIIPQWLQREESIAQTLFSISGESDGAAISSREFVLKRFTEGRICKNCNNEWMSQIESENKSHILNLMRMEDLEVELNYLYADGNHSFAKWIYKTSILLNSASGSTVKIPHSHYLAIYQGYIPDGVVIEIAFSRNELYQWKVHDAEYHKQEENDEPYTIYMQLRNLLIRVAYCVDLDGTSNDSFEVFPICGLNGDYRIYEDLTSFMMHCDPSGTC